jgi:hypothetical protein
VSGRERIWGKMLPTGFGGGCGGRGGGGQSRGAPPEVAKRQENATFGGDLHTKGTKCGQNATSGGTVGTEYSRGHAIWGRE